MAKLKVGDIVIEDGNISFGGQSSTPAPPSQPARAPAPVPPRKSQLLENIAQMPFKVRPFVTTGSITFLLGLALLLAVSWSNLNAGPSGGLSLYFLLVALPLVSIGGALFGFGMVKHLLSRPQAQAAAMTVDEQLFQARMAKLRPHLADASETNTVENLVKRSGMTERALVETLFLMKERKIVEEELNFDSGDWYYVLSDRAGSDERRPLALEERVQRRQEDLYK